MIDMLVNSEAPQGTQPEEDRIVTIAADATAMRMGDGGCRSAYNIPRATGTKTEVIGDVTNAGAPEATNPR
jgi:hypothetical protein